MLLNIEIYNGYVKCGSKYFVIDNFEIFFSFKFLVLLKKLNVENMSIFIFLIIDIFGSNYLVFFQVGKYELGYYYVLFKMGVFLQLMVKLWVMLLFLVKFDY